MTTTSLLTRTAGALMLMAMAGCASVAPRSEIPGATDRYIVGAQSSPAAADAGVVQGMPTRTWWRDFADPSLNALIELALRNNHDLKAALASVDEARAMAGAARREALPTGGLEAKAEQSQLSAIEADPYRQGFPRPPSHRLLNVGQFLSWAVDLYGRIGPAAAVAERQADVAQADAHAAATLLQGEVARHYFEMRRNQQALRSLETEVDLLERRVAKMNARYEAGLVDRRAMLAATDTTACPAGPRTFGRRESADGGRSACRSRGVGRTGWAIAHGQRWRLGSTDCPGTAAQRTRSEDADAAHRSACPSP